MTLTLDSSDVAAKDVVGALRHVVCDSVLPCDITHEPDRPDDQIQYRLRLTDIGPIQLFTIACSPNTVTRTHRLAQADPEPAIFVHLPNSGVSGVAQGDREVTVRTGDLTIIDSSTPYTLHFDRGMDQHYFRIPRATLALPDTSIRTLTATSLGHQPIGKFVASYLRRLAASSDLPHSGPSALLAEPTINLMRAVLSTQLADSRNSRPALEATLELRIIDYMTKHLAAPDLTVKQIAFAHHISVRYLYVVLARAGIAPSEWIRTRRLDACRHELMTPEARNRSIASIARGWGFLDATRFSRSFQIAYGFSPQEWREISHLNSETFAEGRIS